MLWGGGVENMVLGEVGGTWESIVSRDDRGTGNGGRRARERPQPEQGWGSQIYPLSYLKLLTEY